MFKYTEQQKIIKKKIKEPINLGRGAKLNDI